MHRTAKDFFNDFDKLIELNNIIMNYAPTRLLHYEIYEQDVGPEDIIKIIEGIKEGDMDQFVLWPIFEEYCDRTVNSIIVNIRLQPTYNQYDEPIEKTEIEQFVYDTEWEMEKIISKFKSFEFRMSMRELIDFFGLMKYGEAFALKSLERQGISKKNNKRIKLPSDLIDYEIGPYIGKKKRKGGKTKVKRNKINKSKTLRNRGTKKKEMR